MSVTDFSQVATPGSGDKIRCETLTVDGDVVKQQVVTVADPDGNVQGRTSWISTASGATVTASDSVIVAANANRRGLLVINVSNFTVSLGIGSAAVLNHGKTLFPRGSWQMDSTDFTTAAVHAIASGSATLAIEELTK